MATRARAVAPFASIDGRQHARAVLEHARGGRPVHALAQLHHLTRPEERFRTLPPYIHACAANTAPAIDRMRERYRLLRIEVAVDADDIDVDGRLAAIGERRGQGQIGAG